MGGLFYWFGFTKASKSVLNINDSKAIESKNGIRDNFKVRSVTEE